jgi:hypothetical protein
MADVVAELEAALTTGGTLLLWAEKYRHADADALPELRRRLLALGDRARRLARAGDLEAQGAQEVLGAVTAVNRATRRLIDHHRSSMPYRRAVEARRTGPFQQLVALLPEIFADLDAAPPPAVAFWAPVWQSRGRPLPAERVASDLRDLDTLGIAATGDDLAPGVDPDLSAVLLSFTMPLGAPLALRYDGTRLPRPALRLRDDLLVVPVDRLCLPFVVAIAAPEETLDEWVADPPAYLDALAHACRQQGFTVTR